LTRTEFDPRRVKTFARVARRPALSVPDHPGWAQAGRIPVADWLAVLTEALGRAFLAELRGDLG
jgi:hypothetical protein